MRTLMLQIKHSVSRSWRAAAVVVSLTFAPQAALAQVGDATELHSGSLTGLVATPNSAARTSMVIIGSTNTNNPTGNTFAAIPAPTPTVEFVITDNPIVNSATPTGRNLSWETPFLGPLNGIGGPTNGMFTSAGNSTAGTGIDVAANYGVRLNSNLFSLRTGYSATGRHRVGQVTINFSSPVKNPLIHFGGLGGAVGGKGFTTEFNVLSSTQYSSISRVSGNSAFTVSGMQVNNVGGTSGTNPHGASCVGTAQMGGCGTIRVIGDAVTSVVLDVFARSGNSGNWSGATSGTGDALYMSYSADFADMRPTLSNLPSLVGNPPRN